MIISVLIVAFLIKFNSTFKQNLFFGSFFSSSLLPYFADSISYVWLVDYTCICMIHGDGCSVQKKMRLTVRIFPVLIISILTVYHRAPTANLIPWIENAEDYFFNLRTVFIGNKMSGRARCWYKVFLIAASRMQISIPRHLPISGQKVYIKR